MEIEHRSQPFRKMNIKNRTGQMGKFFFYKEKISFRFIECSFGQLTTAGIEQQYRLGQFIRNRYQSLLNETYERSQIFVRSTDVDRTLMSAQSNLAGLYPIVNSTDDGVPIQPIPIHTVAINTDFVCSFSS